MDRDGSDEDDPALLTEMTDRFGILVSVLDRLPVQSRQIAKMRIVVGLTFQQIADQLALSVETVKSRFRRDHMGDVGPSNQLGRGHCPLDGLTFGASI